MCGICGYVRQELIPNSILKKMNDTMYHRGPNDSGTWEMQYDTVAIGMAQRRLSILDLTILGHQPMLAEDASVILVFNGEIYNYKLLQEELTHLGYQFHSHCDTEVIIAAYREWGCDCFTKFNGMFAIALYDVKKEQTILARDRIGKKPLYYYHKGSIFAYGSELKPIMQFPDFAKHIRQDMIADFLCNKYIASPNTIFEDTHKMHPGTYVIYEHGTVTTKVYWDIAAQKELCDKYHIQDYEENKKQLSALLTDSVQIRLSSDVPVGTFLSGGIDSTLVTAIAQQITDEPVRTFSIGFHDKERNEAPYAAEIAHYLGTKHKELYVGETDILNMLEDLPYYFDEPFSDSSQLPTMLVSKMASEDITVALSGDGGDELFCGYKMYDWTWVAQHADWIGGILYHMPGMHSLEHSLPPELRAFIQNRSRYFKTQLYIDVMIEEANKLLGKNNLCVKYASEANLQYDNWQERRMMLDMMTYLPDEILTKTDRASMKYSLEVRCPILDYRVIEQSFRVPHSYKYAKFDKKHILKDITYQYVPKELLNRPKKGFGVPLRKWLRTVLKKRIEQYAEVSILARQGIFVPSAVIELINQQEKSDKIMYSSLLWSFYIFQSWYEAYIENLWED